MFRIVEEDEPSVGQDDFGNFGDEITVVDSGVAEAMRWLSHRGYRPARDDDEINLLFDDASIDEVLQSLKVSDLRVDPLPRAAKVISLSDLEAELANAGQAAPHVRSPNPEPTPDDALSFSFDAKPAAPPPSTDDALSFSFDAKPAAPAPSADDALSFSFDARPTPGADDDALSFDAPRAAAADTLARGSDAGADGGLSFSFGATAPAPARREASRVGRLPAAPAEAEAPRTTMQHGEILFTARSDLTAETIGDKFIIQDPQKNAFTQLGVGEYLVLRCFDGKSTLEDISARLKRERDVVVTPQQIARFRDRLHEKQLVLAPGEVVTSDAGTVDKDMGVLQRVATIDIKLAFNPDQFLLRLYHAIKYIVFRPAFFVGLAVVVALACEVWMTSWGDIRRQISALDFKTSLPLFYICYAFTAFVHETAHGVVCRGFGGTVPRMGMFFYFFSPAFFTDVSSSWMFQSKFRKLMVMFAGAISNLALCALSTLMWRITNQGFVNDIWFALMLLNAFASTYTLIPLMQGDGYYIVSTAVDIPNLRKNAHRYLRAWMRKKFLRSKAEMPKATPSEARAYFIYAPLELLWFAGFGTYTTYMFFSWFLRWSQLYGFLVIAFVMFDGFVRPVLRRAISSVLGAVSHVLRNGSEQGIGQSLAVLARPFRDAARASIKGVRYVAVPAVLVGILALIPYDVHISAPFEVMSSAPVTLRTKTGGILKRYTVASGAWVKPGDVVAELDDDQLMLEREGVAAELEEERARLAELEAGARKEDIAAAQVGARAQRDALALAAQELRRVKMLYSKGISSRKELDEAKAAYNGLASEQRQAAAQLKLVSKGAREEDIERQRAVVKQVELALSGVDQRVEWTKIRAANEGEVVTPPYLLEQRVGKRVAAGDGVIEVIAPAQLVGRLAVPERFTSDIEVGTPIELRFYSDPEISYTSRLERVEPTVTGQTEKRPGQIGMLTSLGHLGRSLPLGAKGIAKLDVGSNSILGIIVRRAHRAVWVDFWSWW